MERRWGGGEGMRGKGGDKTGGNAIEGWKRPITALEEMKMDIASVISLPSGSGVSSGTISGLEQTVEYFLYHFGLVKTIEYLLDQTVEYLF